MNSFSRLMSPLFTQQHGCSLSIACSFSVQGHFPSSNDFSKVVCFRDESKHMLMKQKLKTAAHWSHIADCCFVAKHKACESNRKNTKDISGNAGDLSFLPRCEIQSETRSHISRLFSSFSSYKQTGKMRNEIFSCNCMLQLAFVQHQAYSSRQQE